MKRSFKSLLMIIMILVSLIGSSIQAVPVDALGAIIKVTTNLPAPLEYGSLNGVWSADASNVFVVGYGRQTMTSAKIPVVFRKSGGDFGSTAISLPSGWGTGELYNVWGTNTSNVFAVGTGGVTTSSLPMVSYWNGSTWVSSIPPLPTTPVTTAGYLYGVWGASTSDVYAVGKGVSTGNYAMMSHWNGSAWASTALTLPTGWNRAELGAVWGSSASDIYAVGNGGNSTGSNVPLLYHYNGSTWASSSLPLPSTSWNSGYLVGIWGSGASDIYAVGSGSKTGDSGNITAPLMYHYNGSTWSAINLSLPSTSWNSGELKGIWGFGTDVYAVGFGDNGGTTVPFLYRKTSTGWAISSYPPTVYVTEHFGGISGSSATDVYVAGLGTQIEAEKPLIYHAAPDTAVPGNVTNFVAGPARSDGAVKLSWTAPADDSGNANSGPVSSYLVKYSSSNNLTTCNDADGILVNSGLPTPSTPGTRQVMKVSGLTAGATYYFSICAVDEESNQSANPAIASGVANTGNLPPEKVTLLSPSGSISVSQPTYVWNADYEASWYYLWVDGPSGNVIKTWYTSAQANCNGSTCSVTPALNLKAGTHVWSVQTYSDAGGYGPWSTSMSFAAPVPTKPGQAALVYPTGSITTKTPAFTWNQVNGAASYYLWVDGPSGNVIKQWYTAAQANCNGSICSVTSPIALNGSTYSWAIQTWNDVGYGLWSANTFFTIVLPTPPAATTLSSPSGSISSTTPTYTWIEVSGATWYYLWVDGPSGNVIKNWYTSAQANCGGGVCSVTPAKTLSVGAHIWSVQTYNDGGYGPWSTSMSFNVAAAPAPGAATLNSPTGSITTKTPAYTWNEVSSATWYYMWVDGPSGNVIKNWYTRAQANCNGSTCSVTPATTLNTGSYTWKVQTYNDGGYGPWSTDMTFAVSGPGKAVLTLPTGTISSHNPTYTWNEVSDATYYYLWVDGPSGNVIKIWYTRAQANCNGSTCSVTPATTLASGAHVWAVQTYNDIGYGPWSTSVNFTVSP